MLLPICLLAIVAILWTIDVRVARRINKKNDKDAVKGHYEGHWD